MSTICTGVVESGPEAEAFSWFPTSATWDWDAPSRFSCYITSVRRRPHRVACALLSSITLAAAAGFVVGDARVVAELAVRKYAGPVARAPVQAMVATRRHAHEQQRERYAQRRAAHCRRWLAGLRSAGRRIVSAGPSRRAVPRLQCRVAQHSRAWWHRVISTAGWGYAGGA